MKPWTVFWIAYCSAVIMLDLAIWRFENNTTALVWAGIAALSLAYWIWRGAKENRHHRDMQNLINDMAKQIINSREAKK